MLDIYHLEIILNVILELPSSLITENFSCPFCLMQCASFKVGFHLTHSFLAVPSI
ncbi:hypothetical protein CK203_009230 [Vitis vinifera]|uniref:Uncharacterized protein n=1 Tax=Vitis vinifera TaxID=29760 RepID=A0A438K2S2_VITVI|nr:hypothetical protein CK203_009230 [Vitis vinifera]